MKAIGRRSLLSPLPSNELVGQIHDRMPAILEPSGYDRWLRRPTSVMGVKAAMARTCRYVC